MSIPILQIRKLRQVWGGKYTTSSNRVTVYGLEFKYLTLEPIFLTISHIYCSSLDIKPLGEAERDFSPEMTNVLPSGFV